MKRIYLFGFLLLSTFTLAQSVGTVLWQTARGSAQATVATPAYDHDTGSYVSTVTVTITDATGGAAISTCEDVADCVPGTAYTAPITVTTNGHHLCANATHAGMTTSATKCATYTITTPSSQATDTFTGSFANLTTHTSDTGCSTGCAWTVGDSGSIINLDGGGLAVLQTAGGTSGFGIYVSSLTPSSADYCVSATLSDVLGAGVVFHWTDVNNYDSCQWSSVLGNLRCASWVGGSGTLIGTPYDTTVSIGDVLKACRTGNTVTFSHNGTQRLSGTDTANTGAGKAGIMLGAGASLTAWSVQ